MHEISFELKMLVFILILVAKKNVLKHWFVAILVQIHAQLIAHRVNGSVRIAVCIPDAHYFVGRHVHQ